LQQNPSTQKLLAQFALMTHAVPLALAQAPLLQTPGHSLSGSVPLVTLAQVPLAMPVLAMLQAWHRLAHVVLQQTESTQLPLWHSEPTAHGVPFGATQEPEPLQTAAPGHSASGSVPLATFPQVPSAPLPFLAALHARHVPVHELLQQTPSTQKPLWHNDGDAHADPCGSP